MLPASWKPVAAGGLVRVGSERDGGYIVSKRAVLASKLLIGMGVNDDWRFEDAFRRLGGARIVCFDHTVNFAFWARYYVEQILRLRWNRLTRYFGYRRFFGQPGVEHRLIRIGYDQPGGVSVAGLMREFGERDICLKIDIEGSEYRILDEIVAHADRVTSVVMELHDLDLHRERVARFIDGMKDFAIVFLHANNFGGTDGDGDPLVIEISLVRKDLLDPPVPGEPSPALPANDTRVPDIALRFAS
ncbi:hypothetical protein [Bosea sp. 124]|uniref:hypothetical protein n=1 Tax=Bosea sp. 124 TaxID=2135642 RepID=UPI000D381983|nr:hypothetical protein [Bosea sp. 124]PTM40534.1 hypothetical protein C8D03_2059 [Bosea sp. 124]